MKTNSSEKRKINILDLIVVIILALAVVFGVFALTGGDKQKQTGTESVLFTFEATGNEPEILNYIEKGQTVYDNTQKTELGTVVSISQKPTRMLAENHQEKTLEYVELSDEIDLILEIEAVPQAAGNIKIGKRFHCRVGDTAVTGTVVGIDYDETVLDKKEETK